MQLITPISTSTTRTKGIQNQYNALSLADHILLCNQVKSETCNRLDMSDMSEEYRKPLCYSVNDNYILLMPLIN